MTRPSTLQIIKTRHNLPKIPPNKILRHRNSQITIPPNLILKRKRNIQIFNSNSIHFLKRTILPIIINPSPINS